MADDALSDVYRGVEGSGEAQIFRPFDSSKYMDQKPLMAAKMQEQKERNLRKQQVFKALNPNYDKLKMQSAFNQYVSPKYKELKERVINELQKTGDVSDSTLLDAKFFMEETNAEVNLLNSFYDRVTKEYNSIIKDPANKDFLTENAEIYNSLLFPTKEELAGRTLVDYVTEQTSSDKWKTAGNVIDPVKEIVKLSSSFWTPLKRTDISEGTKRMYEQEEVWDENTARKKIGQLYDNWQNYHLKGTKGKVSDVEKENFINQYVELTKPKELNRKQTFIDPYHQSLYSGDKEAGYFGDIAVKKRLPLTEDTDINYTESNVLFRSKNPINVGVGGGVFIDEEGKIIGTLKKGNVFPVKNGSIISTNDYDLETDKAGNPILPARPKWKNNRTWAIELSGKESVDESYLESISMTDDADVNKVKERIKRNETIRYYPFPFSKEKDIVSIATELKKPVSEIVETIDYLHQKAIGTQQPVVKKGGTQQQQSTVPKEGSKKQFKEGMATFKNGKWVLDK